jgi:hypothetical protein
MTDKELEEFIYVGENKFIELAMIFGDVWTSKAIQIAAEYKALLAQPEPEELGEIIPADEEQLKRIARLVKLEKEWVGLTDDEIDSIAVGDDHEILTFARAIEAKLKEKNT